MNAERIYKILKEQFLKEKELLQLEKEFYVDDHKYWVNQQPNQKPNPLMQQKWEDNQRRDRDRPGDFSRVGRRTGRRFSGSAENREQRTV